MEQDILMREFDSDTDSLLDEERDKSSPCTSNEDSDEKYPSNAQKYNEIDDIVGLFDDDYYDEMPSLQDDCSINDKKNKKMESIQNSFKREPSVDLDCDYDHLSRTCFEDNSVNNLTELREEVIHSQPDAEHSNIFLDNSQNSKNDAQVNGNYEISSALSDHNYMSKPFSYEDIKNVTFGLASLVTDLTKDPKKKEIEIKIDQISNTLKTIKTILGVGSSVVIMNSPNESGLTNGVCTTDKNNDTLLESDEISRSTKENNTSKENWREILDINDNSLNEKPTDETDIMRNEEVSTENDKINNLQKVENSESVSESEKNTSTAPENDRINYITVKLEKCLREIENSECLKIKCKSEKSTESIKREDNNVMENVLQSEIKGEQTKSNFDEEAKEDETEIECETEKEHDEEKKDETEKENLTEKGNSENQCERPPSNERAPCENEIDSGGTDQVMQEEFPENCSEPLEYYSKTNSESVASDLEQTTTITTVNDSKPELKKLNELCLFGKRIVKSCEDLKVNENGSVDDVLNDIIREFQAKFCQKTYADMSVQTEYKFLSKEKQKKINDKEKERLLAESDSCTDDEFDRNSQYSESDVDQSSDEENLSQHKDENHSDIGEHSQHSSDTDGLDLTKYVEDSSDDDSEKKSKNSSVSAHDSLNRRHSFDSSDEEMHSDTEVKENNDHNIDDSENMEFENKIINNEHMAAALEEHVQSDTESSDSYLKDEKLNLEPVVVLNQITDEDMEDYYHYLREKKIEKLENLKSLDKRIIRLPQYTTSDKTVSAPSYTCKKTSKLLEMFNDAEKDVDSDESNTEEEEEVITEKEYLARCNENLKQQLLKATSSDSDVESELSVDDGAVADESDSSNDSQFPSLVDKFLENFISNESVKDQEVTDANKEIIGVLQSKKISKEQENLVEKESEHDKVQKISEIQDKIELPSVVDDVEIQSTEDIEKLPDEDTKQISRKNLQFNNRYLKEKKFDIEAIESTSKAVDGKEDTEDSDCEILHDSLITKPRKEKSLDVLLAEYENRRKNAKVDESISLSSESSSDLEENINEEEESRKRKPMLRQDQLAGETRIAQKEENSRIQRLEKKHEFMLKALKEYYKSADKAARNSELILDYITETKTFIKVHPDIVKQLKHHQIEGVKFMYDAVYGSVEHLKKHPGSGCILAHCMGLGKTLQLIALLHTVISHKEAKTSKILVLCPKSTVMNWKDEIQRWLGTIVPHQLKVYSFPDTSDIQEKIRLLQEWSKSGTVGNRKAGCFLMGYEAFRTLVFYHHYKKQKSCLTANELDAIKAKVKETLLQPGADLVICDEGHIIKNRKSAISLAVAEIKTLRRVILTGTPIQNNLKEYYSMVNFIKPSFLGTEREFANLYANPIKCGQHKDSSKKEIKIMKQRSFVLHKKLSKFVQRKEAALLKSFLPEKYEFVLFIPMSEVQNKLYEFFLESVITRDMSSSSKGKSLIPDYTCLRKVWTHPKVLENAWQNAISAKNRRESKKTPTRINSDDEEPDDVYDKQTGLLSVTNDWWRPLITDYDLESLLPSNKLRVMFEILRMCQENGEKCLIFSAFVAVLNVVEHFMRKIHQKDFGRNSQTTDLGFEKFNGPWIEGQDYYRLDGKTPKTMRHEMVKRFNNPDNRRAKCFLISAKAGGQGINLIGANRVIILDTSWNPSNDQQNIFRIFRLGQKRKCFVYRLLAMGTMEEKVYSRSVTKQAMSFRVVDEQQIDRHYSMAELAELYSLTQPNYAERPVPLIPRDNILASLLHNHRDLVFKYHEHDSLLENKLEQELSEQEKADAWAAYEMDLLSQGNPGLAQSPMDNLGMLPPGPGNFLPPFAGFPGRNYQMGYPPGMPGTMPPSLLSPYNYSSNAILDIYNMYQNFPVSASPLMSRINTANHMNPAHQFSSNSNALLASAGNIGNPNMLPPGMNNLAALGNLAPFNNLANLPQSTSNNTLTSSTPSYTSVNSGAQYHPPPAGVDNYRRFLDSNNPSSSLELGSKPQQKASGSHQIGAPKVTSSESIPTSVITNSDIYGPLREHLVEQFERSSPKSHVIPKSAAGTLSSSTLNQLLTAIPRSSPMNNSTTSHPNPVRAVNMGILYQGRNSPSMTATAKTTSSAISSVRPTDPISQSGNISVRSVSSINNATSSNSFRSSVTAPPVSSISKMPVIYTPVDRNISRGPVVSTHSNPSPVVNKEPTIISVGPNKPYGHANQIQLTPYKPVKNTSNTSTLVTAPSNSASIRPISTSISTGPVKIVQAKPLTSLAKFNNGAITPVKVISNPNSTIKTVNKVPVQSPNSIIHANPVKLTHGNIRTKIVNRNMPPNVSLAPVISKQSIPNIPQNIIRPNHIVNTPKITKVNPTIPGTTILSSVNKTRPQVLVSNTPPKISTILSTSDVQKMQAARNNAALSSLTERNNISIRPLENKFTNAGITISPARKVATVGNHVLPQVRTNVTTSAISSNDNSLLKETLARKRPAPSNIISMLSENSPISVRQVKRPRMATPPSLGVRNTSDPQARVQNAQGLTIVPRSSQNNQRLPKEGQIDGTYTIVFGNKPVTDSPGSVRIVSLAQILK